ncbi:hypothetical protein ACOME3_005078 [Neoechinorhynchus agilis]
MSLNANIRTMITNLIAASVSPTCKVRRNIRTWISINDPNAVYKIMQDICSQIENTVNEQNPPVDFLMLGKKPSEMKKLLENRFKMAIKPLELLGRASLILSFYCYGLSTPSVSEFFLQMCTRLNQSDQTTLTCLLSALLFDGDKDRKTTINNILASEGESPYDKNCPYSSLSDLIVAIQNSENGQSTELEKPKETKETEHSNGKGSNDGKKESIKSPDLLNGTQCIENGGDPLGKYESDDEPFGWSKHIEGASKSTNNKNVNIDNFRKQETKPQTESRLSPIRDIDSQCKMLKEGLSEKEKLLEDTNRRLKEISAQNDELNAQIVKLRMITRKIENDFEERDKKCSDQNMRITELAKQNANLKEDLRLAKSTNADLSKKENELKSFAEDAQEEVIKLKEYQKKILESLNEKENHLIDNKRRLKEVSNQNNELSAKISVLTKKQKINEYEIEQKNKKCGTLSSELEEMTKENRDLKTKLSSAQREKEINLSKTEREMQCRINESQRKIINLERSLKEANEKFDAKVLGSSETEKHLEKVIKRNEEMVVELKANGQLINNLKAKLNRLKEINDKNEIERKARDLQIAELEAKLKAEIGMAAKEVEQFSQKEIKWKTDERSLQLKLQNIMEKLEHLEQSRNLEENTRLMESKEENLRLQGCLGNAQSEICDLKTKSESLNTELREKNTKLTESSMKLENLLMQNGELSEKVETIQRKFDCVLSENQNRSKIIQTQESEISKLKAELRENVSVYAQEKWEMMKKINGQMIEELKKSKLEKNMLLKRNKDFEDHFGRNTRKVTVLEQPQELKSQMCNQTKDFEDTNNRPKHRLRLFERMIRRLLNWRIGN